MNGCGLSWSRLTAEHFLLKSVGELQFMQQGVAEDLAGHPGGDEVTVRFGIIELYQTA